MRVAIFFIAALTIIVFVASSFAASSDLYADFGPVQRIPLDPTDCHYLVVFLHGLGDGETKDGNSWVPMLGEISLSRPHVCFLLPVARRLFVKVAKRETTAWFDVSDAGFRDVTAKGVDIKQVKASAEYILKITRKTQKEFDVPWKRTIFAGFSMGGAQALYVGLTAPERPAGIVAIGAFLPAQSELLSLAMLGEEYCPGLQANILFIHGAKDRVVNIEHARHAEQQLQRVGAKNVQLYEGKELQHGLDDDGMVKLTSFLDSITPRLSEDL